MLRLRNHKAGVYFVLAETANVFLVHLQQLRSLAGGAIAEPNPDDLGWKSKQETTLMEIPSPSRRG